MSPAPKIPDEPHLLRKDNDALIESVAAESPAAEAGIKAGDRLLAVDGIRLKVGEIPFDRYRQKLCMPRGPVNVRVKRDNQELEFDLNWADTPLPERPPPVKKKFLPDDSVEKAK